MSDMSRSTVMDVRIGRATTEVRVTTSRLAVVARSRRWFVVGRPIERRAANCRQPWRGCGSSSQVSYGCDRASLSLSREWIFAVYRGARVPIAGFSIGFIVAPGYRRRLLGTDTHGADGTTFPRGTLHTACLCCFARYYREPPGTPNCVFKFGGDAARRRSPLLGLEPRPAVAYRCLLPAGDRRSKPTWSRRRQSPTPDPRRDQVQHKRYSLRRDGRRWRYRE